MNIHEMKKMFLEIYGGNDSELRIFESPGRVNLIGEHIDYANIVSCEDAAGIVAYYDQVGDTLRFMDAVIYTVNANNIQNVVKNVNYDVTKVFLWEDLETIKPLADAKEITKN